MTKPRNPSRPAFPDGSHVYLRPVHHLWFDDYFLVVRSWLHRGWFHYDLIAPDGSRWTASQLELSFKPINRFV